MERIIEDIEKALIFALDKKRNAENYEQEKAFKRQDGRFVKECIDKVIAAHVAIRAHYNGCNDDSDIAQIKSQQDCAALRAFYDKNPKIKKYASQAGACVDTGWHCTDSVRVVRLFMQAPHGAHEQDLIRRHAY